MFSGSSTVVSKVSLDTNAEIIELKLKLGPVQRILNKKQYSSETLEKVLEYLGDCQKEYYSEKACKIVNPLEVFDFYLNLVIHCLYHRIEFKILENHNIEELFSNMIDVLNTYSIALMLPNKRRCKIEKIISIFNSLVYSIKNMASWLECRKYFEEKEEVKNFFLKILNESCRFFLDNLYEFYYLEEAIELYGHIFRLKNYFRVEEFKELKKTLFMMFFQYEHFFYNFSIVDEKSYKSKAIIDLLNILPDILDSDFKEIDDSRLLQFSFERMAFSAVFYYFSCRVYFYDEQIENSLKMISNLILRGFFDEKIYCQIKRAEKGLFRTENSKIFTDFLNSISGCLGENKLSSNFFGIKRSKFLIHVSRNRKDETIEWEIEKEHKPKFALIK